MKSFKFVLLLLSLTFLFSSCGKDEKTKAELLQDGVWKTLDFKFLGVSSIEDCNKDDTWTFGETIVKLGVGSTQCDDEDVDEEYTYTFSSDGLSLSFDGQVFTVVTLTESSLIFSTDTIFGPAVFELGK